MKRFLAVAVTAVVLTAQGVWAQHGVPCVANGSLRVLCDWGGTGCWQLTTGAGNPENDASCTMQAGYCGTNLYTGTEGTGSCTSLGNTPFANSASVTWSVVGGTVNCNYGPPIFDSDGVTIIEGGCHIKTAADCAATSGTPVSRDECEAINAGTGNINDYHCLWGTTGCARITNPDAVDPNSPNGLTFRENCLANGSGPTKFYNSKAACEADMGNIGPTEYKDFGPCINGVGWECEEGGCFAISDATDRADCVANEYCTVVSVCPPGHAPPAATNIRHLTTNKIRTVSTIRASYNRGVVGVNWETTSRISDGTVSLINIRGVTVASSPVRVNNNSVTAQIGAGNIPTGMYFIRIIARDVSGRQIVQQTPVSIVK